MLNSKKSVFGWSLLFGFIAELIADIVSEVKFPDGVISKSHGFPFRMYSYEDLEFPFVIPHQYWQNLVFWVLTVMVVLSFVYFLKKKREMKVSL